MAEKNIGELRNIIDGYNQRVEKKLPEIKFDKEEIKDIGLLELFERYSETNKLDDKTRGIIEEKIYDAIEADLKKENHVNESQK